MAVIKLSKRMQAVADFVDGKRVADIGCDHAFVSIYLIQTQKAESVIAMDVKEGPLAIAWENVNAYGLGHAITVRLSNGFAAMEENEADSAVIAGMGGLLMIDILRAGAKHTDNGIHLVLQPQSEIDKVREYIFSIGYTISDEKMLFEDGKYYTVIKAVPSDNAGSGYSRVEYMYGRNLLNNRDLVLKQYLMDCDRKNLELENKLAHIHTESSGERLESLHEEKELIQEALHYYD